MAEQKRNSNTQKQNTSKNSSAGTSQKKKRPSKAELEKRGFTVLKSKANFLFAQSTEVDGETLYLELKKRGVLVRHFTSGRISNFNRITIGTKEQMLRLLSAVDEIIREINNNKR